mgnify:FL=1
MPLQAGCDETLKRMNRKYNCEQYYEKLSKIRKLVPDIVFTTDVIVGFPGESEEEFEKTYEFIKKSRLYATSCIPLFNEKRNTSSTYGASG